MLGKKGGVASRLKELSPALQAVHCTAHRLELAFKDAVKNVALCNTVNSLLLNLYLFYKNSSKNRSSLKEAADAVGVPQLFPTRVGGTRWLPHLQRALENFLRGYHAITTQLHQLQAQPGVTTDARAKAKGYLKQLQRKDVVLFAHFMLDVVTVLSKVSLTAQRSQSTVADVVASIDMSLTTLKKYRSKKSSPRLQNFDDTFNSGEFELTGSDNIEAGLVQLVDGLESSLLGRFDDMNDEVLAAMQILSFTFWPQEHEADEDFGDEAVQTLRHHFEAVLKDAGVVVDALGVEWDLLKARMYAKKNKKDHPWATTIPELKEELPNICALMDLLLSIPASSAEAERGFSRLKLVKS
ncbi:PREDICTED: zinc finger protein 862-like [Priapulus caudatus]|uniref:Zinc finger protein 862-like n=1 Tax=Priapulus caudatus TaxID=37621 RepID=A0ABM1F6S7_PRICU|nr:PREDICTED: zinc finger protein 862-like [Priapulus caudatus]